MDAYVNSVARYLFAQSWQIALLAGIVGLISLALRNRSAHIRYLLWLIVLAKCLVPPIYSVPVAVLPNRSPVERLPHPVLPETLADDSVVTDVGASVTAEEVLKPRESKPAVANTREIIVLMWLVGAFLFLLWVGSRAVRYNLWLHRRRMPLPSTLAQEFQELFAGFKFRKSPRIWLAGDIAQPFVWGLFRGSVYLPADFTGLDTPQHHRTVMVHELNHIVRFDAAVNLLQILAQAIFWFHPFVWWSNKKIRQEREKCCDEMVVAQLSTPPEHYTDAIVEALAAERRSDHPIPSLAIVGSVKDIEERIRAMMRPGKKFYKRPSLIAAIVVLAVALATVPTAFMLTARAGTEATDEAESAKSLHEVAADGDIRLIESLISKGADVNAMDERENTPLCSAVKSGNMEAVQLLVEAGADVNAGSWPPLCVAVDEDNIPIAKYLIAHGANINTEGWTALQEAPYTSSIEMVELLIAKGGDVNAGPYTALHGAVDKNRLDIIELLMEKGADINVKAKEGMTPLCLAARYSNFDTTKLLITKGADLNISDIGGFFPLHWAACRGDKDKLGLILTAGNYTNTIHLAACKGDLGQVMSLIEGGIGVNTKDEAGWTPLHWAGLADSPEVAEFLIAKGADVNAKAGHGLTPLMTAHRLPVIDLLISKGADINSKDTTWGRTKLHRVCTKGNKNIAELLIANGADVNARVEKGGGRGRTALHYAALNGHSDVAKLLIAKGADMYAICGWVSSWRQTALHLAARTGNIEVVEWLLAEGFDVNLQDSKGQTALDLAKQENHTKIVELLRKHSAKQ